MQHPHPSVPMGERVPDGHANAAPASPRIPVLAPSCSQPSSKAPNHHFPPIFSPFAGGFSAKKVGNTSGQEVLFPTGCGNDAMRPQQPFLPQHQAKQGKINKIKAKLQMPVRVLSKPGIFPLETTPKSWRRGMLCSPTPLSLHFVLGKPKPVASLAAGKAILQAVWPELLVRAGGLDF